jgi:hypothetical protein
MPRPKSKNPAALIERMLGEGSWLLSHAQALSDYRRQEEAAAEWARAAACEEEVACLLEAAGEEQEAAIHRVSAASCFERLGQHARAVTLLHAALSGSLPADFRARVEKQLASAVARARREVSRSFRRRTRAQAAAVS